MINPALRPDAEVTVGLPGISSAGAFFNQSLFSLSLFDKDSDFQTEFEGQVDDLTVDDYIQTSVDYDLLFVGFGLGETGYLTFGASYRMAQAGKIAPDLFKFLAYGNAPYVGTTLDWSPTEIQGHHYAFYHIGYSHAFLEERLRVGARVKFISGLGAIQTEIDQLSVLTETSSPNPYVVTLMAGGAINMTGIPDDDFSAGDLVRSGYNFFKLRGRARFRCTVLH